MTSEEIEAMKAGFLNGININPVPLEFSNALTTTEWLGALQKLIMTLTTGEYSEQVEQYRQELRDFMEKVPKHPNLKSLLEYDYIADGTRDIAPFVDTAIAAGVKTLYFPKGTYLCASDLSSKPITMIADREAVFTGYYTEPFAYGGNIKIADNVAGEQWSSMAIKRCAKFKGTFGHVGSALQVRTESHVEGSFEWALLSVLDNYSDTGENCGMYSQGNKYGNGPTWGGCMEVNDTVYRENTEANKTGGVIGLEVTYKASGRAYGDNRIGLHLPFYNNDTSRECFVGSGVQINTQPNVKILKGFYMDNVAEGCVGIRLDGYGGVGLDLSNGVFEYGVRHGYAVDQFGNHNDGNHVKIGVYSDNKFRIRHSSKTMDIVRIDCSPTDNPTNVFDRSITLYDNLTISAMVQNRADFEMTTENILKLIPVKMGDETTGFIPVIGTRMATPSVPETPSEGGTV